MGLMTRLVGIPEPQLLPIQEVVNVTEEYKRVAAKVGANVLSDPDGEKKKFERFLTENGIRVYPFQKVEAFLRQEASRMEAPDGYSRVAHQWARLREYHEPIPFPVLCTMEKVKDAFPTVEFMVSTFRYVPKADPFLLAQYAYQNYVIEHWDEPGFLPFLNKK